MERDRNTIIKKKTKLILVVIFFLTSGCIRYMWALDAHPCFEDDEYQTEEVAHWYSNEMSFLPQIEVISELRSGGKYDRAWPFTIVLGNWIHWFGFSEKICREPSAVFGILTVLSLFYISYRLYNSVHVSCVACILLMSEPILSGYFRLARMYSMAVFLSLWMYYMIYRMLSLHNPFISNCAFLDFQPVYAIVVGLLSYLCYQVHVNTLIMGLGVMAYILVYAVLGREKRYLYWCFFIAIIVLVLIIGIVYSEFFGSTPFATDFFDMLKGFGAIFKNIYPGYFRYFLEITTDKWIGMVLLVLIVLIDIVSIKRRIIEPRDIYVLLLCVVTVFFFVFMTDRYFIEYYMCMLMPFAALFFSSFINGIDTLGNMYNIDFIIRILKPVLIGLLCVLSVIHIVIGYEDMYTSKNAMNYSLAYATIYQVYEREEVVPIVSLFARDPYLKEIVPNTVRKELNRSEDMDILYDFAVNEKNEGIVTCEDIKLGALTQGMISFIMLWSDHLSGDGIDNSNVEVSHYNYLMPEECFDKSNKMDLDLISYQNNDSFYILADVGKIQRKFINDNIKFISVAVDLTDKQGNINTRYYQLVTDKEKTNNKQDLYCYIIHPDRLRGIIVDEIESISLHHDYVVYAGGKLVDSNGNELL